MHFNVFPFLKLSALSGMWGKFKGIQPSFPNTWLFWGLSSILGQGSGKRMANSYFAIFYATEIGSSLVKPAEEGVTCSWATSLLWNNLCASGKSSKEPTSDLLFSACTTSWLTAPQPKLLIFKGTLSAQAVQHSDQGLGAGQWWLTANATEQLTHSNCTSVGEAADWQVQAKQDGWMMPACCNQWLQFGLFSPQCSSWLLKSMSMLLGSASSPFSHGLGRFLTRGKRVFQFWLTWKSVTQLYTWALMWSLVRRP